MHLFVLLFTLLFTQNSWAFKLSLVESTITLGQGRNSLTATIINDGENMIAIEAGMRVRAYNENGEERLDVVAEDIIVIPSQVIVPPGAEQVLSIRWVGPGEIPIEQAYRLLVEYVSISDDKLQLREPDDVQTKIDINYRVAKSFYVAPKGAKPNVALTAVRPPEKMGDQDVVGLTFTNKGSQHQIIHALNLQFRLKETDEVIPMSLTKDQLGGSFNVLANGTKEIKIPLPDAMKAHLEDEFTVQILNFGE